MKSCGVAVDGRSLILVPLAIMLAACTIGSPVPRSGPTASLTTDAILAAVVPVSRHVEPVPLDEVESVERDLALDFPGGYVRFITRFGEGDYCDLFRFREPTRIRDGLEQDRQLWREQYYEDQVGVRRWFFEGSESILSPAQLESSVLLGDTKDGDQLVFHAPQPDTIFVMPRHSEVIDRVRADFTDLHEWDTDAPRALTFQPYAHQAVVDFDSNQFSIDQQGWLQRSRLRWGSDGVLVTHEQRDDWSWSVVLFLPRVGARLQVVEDEGVTRTTVDENGNAVTIEGSGQRTLWINVRGDREAIPEIRSFVSDLQAKGLLTLRDG